MPGEIAKDKGSDQHHLNLSKFVMPAKNLSAKSDQTHEKSDCQNVHHIFPTQMPGYVRTPARNYANVPKKR